MTRIRTCNLRRKRSKNKELRINASRLRRARLRGRCEIMILDDPYAPENAAPISYEKIASYFERNVPFTKVGQVRVHTIRVKACEVQS